jgi:hypothetical protein
VEKRVNRSFVNQQGLERWFDKRWPTGNIPLNPLPVAIPFWAACNELLRPSFLRVVSYHEHLALRLCTAVHKSCNVKVWINVQSKKPAWRKSSARIMRPACDNLSQSLVWQSQIQWYEGSTPIWVFPPVAERALYLMHKPRLAARLLFG